MKIAALILGVIVVIILGIVITVVDRKIKIKQDEIDSLKYDRDVRLAQNWPEYLSYTSQEKIMRLTKLVADMSNLSAKDKSAIYSEYLKMRREALTKLHVVFKGTIPTKKQTKAWESMSIDQLFNEQEKIMSKENVTNILPNIKDREKGLYRLETIKVNIIIAATMIQICALFFAIFSKKG